MSELSTVREFLNKYNALDYLLRELVNGEEGKGYISIYKDTLNDVMEQLQFKSLNQLRNQIAHGVYLTENPIFIDSSIISFLDKHLKRLNEEKDDIKAQMLISIEKRKEKDLAKEQKNNQPTSTEIVKNNDHIKSNEQKISPKDNSSLIETLNSNLKMRTFNDFYKMVNSLKKDELTIPLGWSSNNFITVSAPVLIETSKDGNEKSLNYLNCIISSLLSRYQQDQFNVFSVGFDELKEKYQNLSNIKFIENKDSENFIDQLDQVIKQRFSFFVNWEVSDIKEYNDTYPLNKIPFILAVIHTKVLTKKSINDLAKVVARSRAAGVLEIIVSDKSIALPKFLLSNLIYRIYIEDNKSATINKDQIQLPLFRDKDFRSLILSLENRKNTYQKTDEEELYDNLYDEIKTWLNTQEYCSISKIIRNFNIGFIKAGKIFSQLQEEHVIDANCSASKGCKVLK